MKETIKIPQEEIQGLTTPWTNLTKPCKEIKKDSNYRFINYMLSKSDGDFEIKVENISSIYGWWVNFKYCELITDQTQYILEHPDFIRLDTFFKGLEGKVSEKTII